jgi:simple sugar transport system ATP-binding protein
MSEPPRLRATGIQKWYGHIEALRGVSISIDAGETLGLIGDNGAGKSTLIKILSGAEHADSGSIELDGRPVIFASSHDARANGIETVYQDLSLAPDMDAAANFFLGRELVRRGILGKLGWLDRRAMLEQAGRSFSNLG